METIGGVKLLMTLIITLSHYLTSSVGSDAGFELLYRDNLDELVDVPLNFTNPLPFSIKGTLIRNGMGRWCIGQRRIRHLLDGYAKLTKISFDGDGMTARFSTKYLQTECYRQSLRHHTIQPYLMLLGLDPPFDFFERLRALWNQVDNLNVNIVRLADNNEVFGAGQPGLGRNHINLRWTAGTGARCRARNDVFGLGRNGWSANNIVDHGLLGSGVGRRKKISRTTMTKARTSYGRFVTTNDVTRMYEFDPRTLTTLRRLDFGLLNASAVVNFLSMISSAHPIQEIGTNYHINFVATIHPPGFGATISLVRIKSIDARETIAHWHASYLPYMHAFALSEHYAIVFQCPLYVNLRKFVETAESVTSLYWQNTTMTDIVVIHIKTGEVRRFAQSSGFTMHFANAYEEESNIIVDAIVYPNVDFLESLQISTLSNQTARDKIRPDSHLTRFTINMKTSSVSSTLLKSDAGKEFVSWLDMPIINERFRFRRYRYIYGISVKIFNGKLTDQALVKKDLVGSEDRFWYEDNQFTSEPTFVENADAKSEDDGHLITVVLDGARRQSYLLVIDAITMTTVSKAPLPTIVPFSIHGKFFHDVY